MPDPDFDGVQEFTVYRLGGGADEGLAGRNAGNMMGVANFFLGDRNDLAVEPGRVLTQYRVRTTGKLGEYRQLDGGADTTGPVGMQPGTADNNVWFSFGDEGFEVVSSRDVATVDEMRQRFDAENPPDPDAPFAETLDMMGTVRVMDEFQRFVDESEPRQPPQTAQTEQTPEGQQFLMEGVEPITTRERVQAAADRPLLAPTRRSDSEIGGMFDANDPARFDLFDQVPVSVARDADGNEVAMTVSRADLEEELAGDEEFAEQLGICLK